MADLFAPVPAPRETAVLEKLYATAGKEITEELLRIDFTGYSELTLISIEKNVKAIVDRLNRLCIKWAKHTVPIVYKDGYAKSKARIESFPLGADKDPRFNNATHRLSAEEAIDIISEDLIKANLSMKINVATYMTLVRKAYGGLQQIQAFDLRDEEVIAGLLDDAIREGASRGKLEQLIRVHFRRQLYERKFININGRNYDLIKYARMVARTRLRKVQSEAVKNTSMQFESDLIEISDHGTTTDVCLPYEGQIFSISGRHPSYPLLDAYPPYHPNCEHSAAPTSDIAIRAREAFA